jgi:hypothetical protein
MQQPGPRGQKSVLGPWPPHLWLKANRGGGSSGRFRRIGYGKNLKGRSTLKPSYQIVDRKDSQDFARYLAPNGQLLLRWVAAAFLAAGNNFRRILDYRDLGMLKAKLESEIALDLRQAVP